MTDSRWTKYGPALRSLLRKVDVIFYESFYEAIRELPDADRLAAYDAICKYGCTGEEPEVSGVVKVVFTLVKPQIDANERRAATGKKGGRPRKTSEEMPEAPEPLQPEDSDQGGKPETDSGEGEEDQQKNQDQEEASTKKATRKREKEPRHKYGSNGKVMLSDRELEKLKSEFPADWQKWIERVDGYCQQMGKSYSDYLQTIRNWAKKDKEKAQNGGHRPGYKNRFHNFEESSIDYSIFDNIV